MSRQKRVPRRLKDGRTVPTPIPRVTLSQHNPRPAQKSTMPAKRQVTRRLPTKPDTIRLEDCPPPRFPISKHQHKFQRYVRKRIFEIDQDTRIQISAAGALQKAMDIYLIRTLEHAKSLARLCKHGKIEAEDIRVARIMWDE